MANSNITLTFKEARGNFFDTDKVKQALDRLAYKKLVNFGAYTMRVARYSMRKRKIPSKPGQPPSSHVGLIKEGQHGVTFGYDTNTKSVVIGATLLNKPSGALHILEYGGTVESERQTIFVKRKTGRDSRGRFASRGVERKELHRKFTIAARPYMQPAFKVAQEKFLEKWKDQLGKP